MGPGYSSSSLWFWLVVTQVEVHSNDIRKTLPLWRNITPDRLAAVEAMKITVC